MQGALNKGPLVTVITPTFNRVKLLTEAIDSVRQQTYSFWEMIIWDDGSTDGTQQMFHESEDSRIQYYRGANRGQAFARNQAMAVGRGEYIAFLDDDDKWLPHKLTRQVEILESHREANILFSNFENLETSTGRTAVSFEANSNVLSNMKTGRLEAKVRLIVGGFAENFLRRNFILPSSTMMRKSMCAAVGPFNETLRGTEDKEYWWRCALHGGRFAYDDEVLVKRRKGEDSFTASGERVRNEDIKALHCCLEDAKTRGRAELVPLVNRAIGNAWENLIRFYVEQNQKRSAWRAFKYRCRYGITPRAVALAAGSLCGPEILRVLGSPRSPSRNFIHSRTRN